uniref:Uncharacterized protein n=1 Tax=Anopheles culicifacies TaxID=139723 RepID=A0A182MA26_9DIPT
MQNSVPKVDVLPEKIAENGSNPTTSMNGPPADVSDDGKTVGMNRTSRDKGLTDDDAGCNFETPTTNRTLFRLRKCSTKIFGLSPVSEISAALQDSGLDTTPRMERHDKSRPICLRKGSCSVEPGMCTVLPVVLVVVPDQSSSVFIIKHERCKCI